MFQKLLLDLKGDQTFHLGPDPCGPMLEQSYLFDVHLNFRADSFAGYTCSRRLLPVGMLVLFYA